jgi:hypothetical protein
MKHYAFGTDADVLECGGNCQRKLSVPIQTKSRYFLKFEPTIIYFSTKYEIKHEI